MKSKIFVFSIIMAILTIALTGCTKEKLYVFNWGQFIDEDVLDMFEKEFNVDIVYDKFDSNEMMYTKLKSGGTKYDVVFPSDYMVERMIEENMLQPLDKDLIPNLANIDERFLEKAQVFDPDNLYAVPYFWGTVGILYDTTKVTEVVDSWDILWNSKYKNNIFMYDSQRDSLMVALKKLGYSMNTKNLNELEEAKNILLQQKSLVYDYVGDAVIDRMISGDAALAVVYSGDAAYIMSENPNMAYAIPKEGTNFWIDAMVIPKNARNKELANKFINFMCREDIAKMNTEEVMYSSPITSVFNDVIQEDWANNIAYNPDRIIDVFGGSIQTEVFRHPGNFIETYNNIWREVYTGKK